jgi:hypothetical protein
MSDSTSNPHTLAGKTMGSYRVEAEIGQSRWGTVYRGFQTSVQRPVVLKILTPEWTALPGKVDHFLAESRAAAQIIHHHIVSMYEAGCADNVFYCAMEYMDGPPLSEFLRDGEVVNEHNLLQTIIGVGRAIEFLWLRNIPHQPPLIKNILVNSHNEVKLTNIAPVEAAQSQSQSQDIEALGYAVAEIANAVGEVSDPVRDLVERMVGLPGRLPFKSADALVAAATKLDHELFPPPAPAVMVDKMQPEKKSPLLWIIAAVIALAAAGGLGYWATHREQSHGAKPARPTDLGLMLSVPAGPLKLPDGTTTNLPAFWIDKYEVTVAEYSLFLQALNKGEEVEEHPRCPKNKNHTPELWEKMMSAIQVGQLTWDSPVFSVDWFDAFAYARWSKKRLPSEQEWERAARGPDNFLYAWGNTYAPGKCNDAGQDRDPQWSEVYAYPDDLSPFGVSGMTGNVSEWTGSGPARDKAIVRGGSWKDSDPKLTIRREEYRDLRVQTLGFRCAADTEVKPKSPTGK